MATFQLLLFSILVSLALSLLIRIKRRARGLKNIRGPPCLSWLTGHEKDIRCQLIAGENELKWTKQYGLVVRLTGCLGQENLLIADPKALHYMFNPSGYRFPKTGDMHHMFNSLFGPGVAAVDGEEHRRQRHVLNPAFSVGQLRTFLGLFQAEGEKLTEKLQANLASQSVVVDILTWTSKAALDVLGITSFRYTFGALDGKEDKLTSGLKTIMTQAFMKPSPAEIVYATLLRVLPRWSLKPLDTAIASRAYTALKMFKTMAKKTAGDLIQNAVDDKAGLEDKDIVGILAANHISENAMSQDAMLAQMVTFIAGGQDTTSNTLGFLLYELARQPDLQVRLRNEIREMLRRKNGEPLTSTDYDALPFMNACIKETLRFRPVLHSLIREAAQDDVLPLSEPLILKDGSTCTEISIRKGQVLYASISVYQQLKSLWGEDTNIWNPDRFLSRPTENDNIRPVGVYANLLAFGAGNRSCIGWRFALMELQVFIVLMVNKFSFEPDVEVKFAPTQVTVFPALEGKYEEGMSIPLRVTALE